ncbi:MULTISPECIES: serine protease [unclassified Bradyrhizobium]|uniref:S1 family peptidase n=1 Tax=unclassified Bradyrhizobium TaxID=2631580 RepID=UPI0028E6AD04|nr:MULTISPECIES: serine protease [unclassified Bradyrhizobium]
MKTIGRRSVLIGGIAAAAFRSAAVEAQTDKGEPNSTTPTPTPAPTSSPLWTKHGISEQLLYTTIMLNTVDAHGNTGSGTASIIQLFTQQERGVHVLLTNKHVVAGAVSVTLKLTRRRPDGSPDQEQTELLQLSDMQNWLPHPDPAVDLIIYPFSNIAQRLESEGRPIFYVALPDNIIPTDEAVGSLSPLEDVVVVGYPDGISDAAHNIPVLRKGITASPAFLDFDGKREFLIDAAIFPGSSGSPVFLYNQGAWLNRDNQVQFGTRALLLGIVWGVRLHTQPGQIAIIPAPTQQAITLTNLPNNLGICIKSSRILEFEPEIVKRGYKIPDGYKMRAAPN